MKLQLLVRYKQVICCSLVLALLTFLLKWLQFNFIIVNHVFEVYIGIIAIIFTTLGIWLATRLIKPKIETVVVEREIFINKTVESEVLPPVETLAVSKPEVSFAGITTREQEVLQLMAAGLSNQEIANELFVSLNTIKTHASKIFEKLEVKRRTQAIEKAQRLGLLK